MIKFLFIALLCSTSSSILANIFSNFAETCTNLKQEKASISAECQAKNGKFYKTALRLRGINNHDGILSVEEDSNMSKFHTTCTNISIDSNGLIAGQCKNNANRYIWSSLDLTRFISNYNGTLVYPLQSLQ